MGAASCGGPLDYVAAGECVPAEYCVKQDTPGEAVLVPTVPPWLDP